MKVVITIFVIMIIQFLVVFFKGCELKSDDEIEAEYKDMYEYYKNHKKRGDKR